MSRINKVGIAILLILVVTILQQKEEIRFFGVKPNIILVFLAILPFFIDGWASALMLVFFSGTLLMWGGGGEWHTIVLIAIGISFFFIKRYLPWKRYLDAFACMLGGTIAFALISAPLFFFHAPTVLLREIVLNSIVGGLLYLLLLALYHNEPGSENSIRL